MKPAPKHTSTVCAACEQPWAEHFPVGMRAGVRKTYQPKPEDCVRVLKAELDLRPPRRNYPQISMTSGNGVYPQLGTFGTFS